MQMTQTKGQPFPYIRCQKMLSPAGRDRVLLSVRQWHLIRLGRKQTNGINSSVKHSLNGLIRLSACCCIVMVDWDAIFSLYVFTLPVKMSAVGQNQKKKKKHPPQQNMKVL